MTLAKIFALTIFLSGCVPAATQENDTVLPKFFTGMTLLQKTDCGSFVIEYYAHPEVSLTELNAARSVKGYGSVVIPKAGSRISQVLTRLTEAPKDGENNIITYRPVNGSIREITGNGLDGHRAPDSAFLEDAALFNDQGVFPTQVSYSYILGANTTGDYGPGELIIDNRIAEVFTADDGSSCTIKPPRIVLQLKPQ